MLSYVFFFLKALCKVSSMALRRRYDAVHVHNMPNFIIFSAVLAKVLGARVLLDVHDLMPVNYMVKFGVGNTHPLIRILVLEQNFPLVWHHMSSVPTTCKNSIWKKCVEFPRANLRL